MNPRPSFWEKAMKKLIAFFGSLVPVAAFAQLDVTAATTAISDGQTAVIAVLTALVVAYGAFLGLRMVKAAVRRG